MHKLDYRWVFTVEEMMPHVSHLSGIHTKNLFLRDKKKKGLWLVSCRHDRPINLNELSKQLGMGSGALRFADETIMLKTLCVGQGCVSPLALFKDTGSQVTLVLDAAFLKDSSTRLHFHPMSNSATLGLECRNFLHFVHATGHEPIVIDFGE
uniref:PrdX deacylase domain-containing protein 1 n=1 Tax=Eptatretus burgeri TaxID=7764 RepID=A0A8C4QAH3_EPTBU